MAYETILFDIDGTLCDPGNSITESVRFALAELNVNETNEQALRRFVGPPLEHSFRNYYDFDDTTVKKAVELFRAKFRRDGINLYKAYDGIPALLEELSNNRKKLAVVTSKININARTVLENTGLLKYFDIVSAQQLGEVVQKEVILSRVLNELGVKDKSLVVMVGDRMHDVEAAKEHEIDSIGVLWGYGTVEELQKEGASHIVKNAQELGQLLL